MTPTCETCRYFARQSQTYSGGTQQDVCRRYPPVVFGTGCSEIKYPSVQKDGWCGEYGPKEHKFQPYSFEEQEP